MSSPRVMPQYVVLMIIRASQESHFRYLAAHTLKKKVFVEIQDIMRAYRGKHMTENSLEDAGCIMRCNKYTAKHKNCFPSYKIICKFVFILGFLVSEICLSILQCQLHASDKPGEQEKFSNNPRTCIVPLPLCFRNPTASVTTGNSSRAPSVIFRSVCCGDAAQSIVNSSLEKKSSQRAA